MIDSGNPFAGLSDFAQPKMAGPSGFAGSMGGDQFKSPLSGMFGAKPDWKMAMFSAGTQMLANRNPQFAPFANGLMNVMAMRRAQGMPFGFGGQDNGSAYDPQIGTPYGQQFGIGGY